MKTSAFLYPWDVVGDPAAADRDRRPRRRAGHPRLRLPLHPGARPRATPGTASSPPNTPPCSTRRTRRAGSGRELRPYPAGAWADGRRTRTARAAAALEAAGLDVHTWVVLAHNSRLGAEHPDTSVVNAYGDRYPWAPCIAQPAVRALPGGPRRRGRRPARRRAAPNSSRSAGTAWPTCTPTTRSAASALGDAAQYLMSLCFCPHCRDGYAGLGADPDELAAAVRARAGPGLGARAAPAGAGLAGIERAARRRAGRARP